MLIWIFQYDTHSGDMSVSCRFGPLAFYRLVRILWAGLAAGLVYWAAGVMWPLRALLCLLLLLCCETNNQQYNDFKLISHGATVTNIEQGIRDSRLTNDTIWGFISESVRVEVEPR